MFYCYKKSIKIRNTHIQRFNFYIYIDFLNLSMNFHVSPMYIITMLFNYSCLANRWWCQKKIVQRKYLLENSLRVFCLSKRVFGKPKTTYNQHASICILKRQRITNGWRKREIPGSGWQVFKIQDRYKYGA